MRQLCRVSFRQQRVGQHRGWCWERAGGQARSAFAGAFEAREVWQAVEPLLLLLLLLF
jgi:hypothetical protein